MSRLIWKFSLSIIINLLIISHANSQNYYAIAGSLQDTSGKVVADIPIHLISGKDTLLTNSDSRGNFSFSKIQSDHITLIIQSLKYQSVITYYKFSPNQQTIIINPIILKDKFHLLNEVKIKGKQDIILLKKDTVEYNAGAYQIYKEDLLEDLLKRLPGIQIDRDGNVTAEGKTMDKLRVNGKDFFTGDIKQFLEQLPADIIAKLQIIDDYGDEANFTGIKTGEPKKMLNLVIKPGMNRGKFGNAYIEMGSNKQYGIGGNDKYWLDTKQMAAGIVINIANNQSGINNTNSISTSYRNTFNNDLIIYSSYYYNNNRSKAEGQSYSESLLNNATIFNSSVNETDRKKNVHNLKTGLEYRPNTNNYLIVTPILNLVSGQTNTQLTSFQTGTIRKDLQQQSKIAANSPAFDGLISMGHHFGKSGRTVTFDFSFTNSRNFNDDNSLDLLGYYNNSGIHGKDSLLQRLIESHLINETINIKFIYSEPLDKNSNVDFIYSFNQTNQTNNLTTYFYDRNGNEDRIDSLSNSYSSSFITHTMNFDYRYNINKLRIVAGLNFQPVILTGQTVEQLDKLKNATYNFFPIVNLVYIISKNNSLGFNYSCSSEAPSYNQLIPTKDDRNLQNVVVGNPYLKPSFNNQLNLNFRHINEKGSSVSFILGGAEIKNRIVTNTVLVLDTLNSLKQETHFLNANGSYNINGGYNFSTPLITINNHKYNLNFAGNAIYSSSISFVNGLKNYSRNLNLIQSASTNFNLNKFVSNLALTYRYSNTQFTTGSGINTAYKTLQFNFGTWYNFTPDLSISFDGNKTFNSGYGSILSSNPLIVNASMKLKLFKLKTGDLRFQAFDLFDQTNNLIRVITDNTITDSRTKYITRYFSLIFSIRFGKFGS